MYGPDISERQMWLAVASFLVGAAVIAISVIAAVGAVAYFALKGMGEF